VISDSTDSIKTLAGEIVTFWANYTNRTSGAAITGASCSITINGSMNPMAYDVGSQSYAYSTNFSLAGVYYYTVSCSASGFESLGAGEYSSIGESSGPMSVRINVSGTSRRDVGIVPPGEAVGSGGNLTFIGLNLLAVTDVWSGMYGNVTGTAVLANAENFSFYEWNLSKAGEVYASRAPDINFPSITCAINTDIINEDSFLSTAGLKDSVNNTFTQFNHPAFEVSDTPISANVCPSTNLHDAFGITSTEYYQVLLKDGADKLVYTTITEPDTAGFNEKNNDFQIMVPTRPNMVETYYFWMELG
jgi:hypothetical protein